MKMSVEEFLQLMATKDEQLKAADKLIANYEAQIKDLRTELELQQVGSPIADFITLPEGL